MGKATAAMAVLLLSVLAHEWSHWLVAYRRELAPPNLIVGPLGGVSQWPVTADTPGGLTCMLAGPTANLVIAVLCALALRVTHTSFELIELINPLRPAWTLYNGSSWNQFLQLTLWINWLLFLVNLLPAYPFDGGHILRSLLRIVRPQWDRKQVAETVYWIAVAMSAIIMTTSLVLWRYNDETVMPPSFATLLLAVVLLVSARRDMDFNLGLYLDGVYDTELEEPWPARMATHELVTQFADEDAEEGASSEELADDEFWFAEEAEESVPRLEEIEAEEERQVDSILSRLHSHGLDSLTAAERALLQKVSERYRNRLGRRG
jgi:Zn-dependent protease